MTQAAAFEGVLYADAVTFTSSPDRTVFSFLYDNFVVEWLPGDLGDQNDKVGSRRLALAAAQGSCGHTLTLDLRAASFGNLGPGAALTVQIGKQTVTVPLSCSEEDPNIYHRIEVTLEEDRSVSVILVTATVPRPEPEDTQATIQIDSIDIALSPPAG